jgi:hypothetical protein
MKVERRDHPRGEQGTRTSIEEAAKRAAEGRLDPRTRAWAIEKIVQAGNPRGRMDRAAVLLEALRRERIYIPDPTDAEFIPSAACTLKGCDGLVFLGEDCDGLLVAFLAAVGSVGIEGAVVGHGYEDDGQLSHVLAAVFDGKAWHLADPSTDQPFGQVDTPKRERWVGVPGINVLCDSTDGNCNPGSIGSGISGARMRPQGDFVGVGAPRGMVDGPRQPRFMPGYVGAPEQGVTSINEPWVKESLKLQVAKLRHSIVELRYHHGRLAILRTQYMDRPIADVDHSPPTDGQWKLADEEYYQSLLSFSMKALEYGEQALAGKRPVAWDNDTKQIVVGGKEGEPVLEIDRQGTMTIKDMPGGGDAVVPAAYGSGQVGITWLAAGVIVVVVAGAYATIDRWCDTTDKKTDLALKTDLTYIFEGERKRGATAEEAQQTVDKLGTTISEQARAKAVLKKEEGSIHDTIQMVVLGTAGVALIGVLAYALISFTPVVKTALEDRRSGRSGSKYRKAKQATATAEVERDLLRDAEAIETTGELVAIEAA